MTIDNELIKLYGEVLRKFVAVQKLQIKNSKIELYKNDPKYQCMLDLENLLINSDEGKLYQKAKNKLEKYKKDKNIID